jgi:hypothetical protein
MSLFSQNFYRLLKHPLFITIITFVFTGVLATNYQNQLSENAKKQDLEITNRQRAADSVKTITDLLYERVFKGNMVVSSIRRHASLDELKDRKKSYDEVFTRYNSQIQSNLFRIREMLETVNYTELEALMEGPLRALLYSDDNCITKAYDDAISGDLEKLPNVDLIHCKIQLAAANDSNDVVEMSMGDLNLALIHCEYHFTNALFRTVEGPAIETLQLATLISDVDAACNIHKNTLNPNNQ